MNQRLLVDSEWRGVGLRDLVLGQTAPFVEAGGSRLAIEGPPGQADLLGGAGDRHGASRARLECVSHGALSVPEGRVAIAWALEGTGTEPRFTMTWKESNGPAVLEPKRKGSAAPSSSRWCASAINGEVDLDYASSGLSWRLSCPTAHVLEPDE